MHRTRARAIRVVMARARVRVAHRIRDMLVVMLLARIVLLLVLDLRLVGM